MIRATSFFIFKNELGTRLDPSFFKPEYLKAYKKVLDSGRQVKKLGELSTKIVQGPNPKSWDKIGIPCLKTKNLYSDEWRFDNLDYITPKEYKKLKEFTLQYNDILIAIVGFGSTGKVNIFKEDRGTFVFTRALGLVRLKKTTKLSPDFLAVFLNTKTGQTLIDRGVTGSTGQLIITTEYLKELPIPIPPGEIQDKIVAIIQEAYKQRKDKLKKAKEVHDSIDDYVLKKLGIEIPQVGGKRSFVVRHRALEKRFDLRFYQPKYKQPIEILEKINSLKTIGEISKLVASGATPRAKGSAYTDREKGIPFIRITNLKNSKIDLTKAIYVKKEIHEGMLKRSQLRPNDVLLSMAGTIGVSAVVPHSLGKANINQALARIVLKEGINPHYVSQFLNSPLGRLQTERLCRPAVQANINLQEINSIKIPVPPLEVQNKIAAEAQRRRQRAEQLKLEAVEAVRKAKEKVEKMILGD